MPFKNFFSKPPNLSEPKIKVIKKEAVKKNNRRARVDQKIIERRILQGEQTMREL